MSKFFSKDLSKLVPYVPGEQLNDKKYVKLNTNESPFAPSPKALSVVNQTELNNLRLYSDPTSTSLHSAIANFYGVDKNCVLATNGSDEVLAFIFRAFCGKDKGIVFPDITYGFYNVFCKLMGIEYREIPLDENFDICLSDYDGIKDNIIIANPNAQTGKYLSLGEIERFVAADRERLIIIDEAYIDFGGESAVGLTKKYDNLIVVQTFSKSRNLAGHRIGFAVASSELIADINTVKYSFNPYNVNRLSQVVAANSIADREYFHECTSKIIQNREYISAELKNKGFNVITSRANFILVESDKLSGKKLYEKLKDKGYLVRYLGIKRIENFVRITIGDIEQMKGLNKAIDEILKEVG